MATKKHELFDLAIVGTGPAGFAAGIAAGSEGLQTRILEASSIIGGQAGTTSCVRNYPGFVGDISGWELMGSMANQAAEFGVELTKEWPVERIEAQDGVYELQRRSDKELILARSVLVAAGVEHRRLGGSVDAFYGRGVEYGFPNRRIDYSNSRVFIVGGANSAGQAALYLSGFEGCEVHLLIRGTSIEERMSSYLCEEIHGTPDIEVSAEARILEACGEDKLEKLVLECGKEGRIETADHLFVMVGMRPNIDWAHLEEDDVGFALAGRDLADTDAGGRFMDANDGRKPAPYETSRAGIFVAGTARSGSVPRIASAVGEGSNFVHGLHRYRADVLNR